MEAQRPGDDRSGGLEHELAQRGGAHRWSSMAASHCSSQSSKKTRCRSRRGEPVQPLMGERGLTPGEQKRFLRAVEKRPLARDRAIGRLLSYSGLRVSELVALDVDADVVDEHGRAALSAHTLRHTFGTNLTRSGAAELTR
ncbi:hypothetical protein AB0I72_14630 [Nocardiopsis sp. NPDC049922]|uniref:hypothetical protein n=1 Tax=Nocardiopsis sp. NPDC049922 TaxID=3155157 RepID=UPI0033FAFA88